MRGLLSQGKERKPSIRQWLFLLVVTCFLPALVAMIGLVYHAYQQQHSLTQRSTIETARALMQTVDRELSSGQGTLHALATSPYLTNGDLAAFYAQAKEVERYLPRNNLMLSDNTGQQLLNTLQPYGTSLPRHGNPLQLSHVFDTAQPVISDLYIEGIMHRPIISIDVPVIRGNHVIYDLSLGFLPTHLSNILRQQRLPSTWIAAILDRNGKVVARTREEGRFLGHASPPELMQRVKEVREDYIESVTLDGMPVFAAFSRSDVSNWVVAIGVPRTALAWELWKSVAWIGGAAAFSLLVGLILATLVAERIASEIRSLNAPAVALGEGKAIVMPALGLKEANEIAQALIRASGLLRERTVERDLAEKAEREVREIQQQLEQSETFQRRIFEEAPNAIILVAPDGRILRVNTEAERLFGYSKEQFLTLALEELMPQEYRSRHADHRESYFSHPVRRPMGNRQDFWAQRADGSAFPVDVMLSPLQAGPGNPVIATVRDVTELRRNEENINAALREKEILLKELYHRVKNNMQVIVSMMNLQGRAITDEVARTALQEATGRVQAMALVHEKLYQSGNLSSIVLRTYITDLCNRLGDVACITERGITMQVEAPPVEIGIDTAVPLGLLLNELISNCLKHAFPNRQRGHIVVRLLQEKDGDQWQLMVSDDGVGIPPGIDPTSSPSLGLKLVAALVQQLGGRFSLKSHQGTVACVAFPQSSHNKT